MMGVRTVFLIGDGDTPSLPSQIMAGRLLKKGADETKRLARTLAPPKSANKNRKTCFLQSRIKSNNKRSRKKATHEITDVSFHQLLFYFFFIMPWLRRN
jgi:hypothetical protein